MPRILGLIAPLALACLAGAPFAWAESDIGNLTPEERSAFRAEVRAYLLENPEVIYEAIQVLEERREEASKVSDRELIAQNAKDLYEDGFSWVGGNPEGDVTMVEFLDYRCPYCKRAHTEVQAVLEADPNIRYIVKEFPILGPESLAASRMALAALEHDPSKYGELHDRLMTHEGQLDEQAAYEIADELGYDVAELKETAATDEIETLVKKNYELATRLGIQGTPSFVIGEQVVRGYIPEAELLAAIEAERERASN